ncbi:MAG: RNA polymerase sigma factor [Coprobacillaceae bacterium]
MVKIRNEEIKKFIDGDDSIFPKIFAVYRNKINYLAIEILHNEADCEEVVQNTFIKIIEKREGLQDERSFNSWVYRIAYNTSLDLYRKNKRRNTENPQDIEDMSDIDSDTENTIRKKVILESIQNQIDDLPNDMREICVLRFVADCSIEEISEIMKIPKGTVKSRLHRAKSKMKTGLRTKEITPTAYLSLVFPPLTHHLFQSLSERLPVLPSAEIAIIKGIERSSKISAESIVNGIADKAISISSVGIIAVTSSLMFGGLGLYSTLGKGNIEDDNSANQISEVLYLDELTNKNLQVGLVFDGIVDCDDVTVLLDNQKIKVENVENDKCMFIVKENGVYNISYKQEKEEIVISNIDKEGPELINISKENGLIKIEATDHFSGIDIDSTYVEEGEKTFH